MAKQPINPNPSGSDQQHYGRQGARGLLSSFTARLSPPNASVGPTGSISDLLSDAHSLLPLANYGATAANQQQQQLFSSLQTPSRAAATGLQPLMQTSRSDLGRSTLALNTTGAMRRTGAGNLQMPMPLFAQNTLFTNSSGGYAHFWRCIATYNMGIVFILSKNMCDLFFRVSDLHRGLHWIAATSLFRAKTLRCRAASEALVVLEVKRRASKNSIHAYSYQLINLSPLIIFRTVTYIKIDQQ